MAPLAFGVVAARLGIAFAFGLVALGLLASLGFILTFQRKGHGA
jgi:dipeptide/tripeptide permease